MAAPKLTGAIVRENVNEAELIADVSGIISGITGVQLGEKQFSLVQGRLAKRMRELKMPSPAAYAKYLNANQGIEIGVLTSLLTTHHTYFFREFSHFEFLLTNTLPSIIQSHQKTGQDTIRIWSAACSRGQEVYSLSMFLRHHLPQLAPRMKFEIFGSDVDEESVNIAKNGVYGWDEIKSVPSVYLQGNWARGTGDISQFVKAKDELRKPLNFRAVNLLELKKNPFGVKAPKFDIIFCRNVFIYFSRPAIQEITRDFLNLMNPEGHLIIGLSESLSGLDLPLEWIGPSVYSLKSASTAVAEGKVSVTADTSKKSVPQKSAGLSVVAPPLGATASSPAEAKRLRVLCVDDSPTILTMLKRILAPTKDFDVVGTAIDGEDAALKAKELKPDVITLDIHMPKLNGVGFLEKYYRSLGVPVVMVSSVSREDAGLAYRALELGASDYIEKPNLQNMAQIEEELMFKLRAAVSVTSSKKTEGLALDKTFLRAPTILKPEGKLRVMVVPFGARESAIELLREFKAPQPATVVLIDGAGEVFTEWAKNQSAKIRGSTVASLPGASSLTPNSVTFMEFDKAQAWIQRETKSFAKGGLVLGVVSPSLVKKITSLGFNHLLVEDRGEANLNELLRSAQGVVPITSFAYESDRWFADSGSAGAKK